MDSIIYYFSWSGNSYKIAKNISERLGNAKLIRISSESMHLAVDNNYKKIGIVFPVYYFSLPKMVTEFVERLSVDENAYIYSVATCGGFIGVSFLHLKEILQAKGCLQLSTFKILMPENYQVLYAPATVEKQQELISKSDA